MLVVLVIHLNFALRCPVIMDVTIRPTTKANVKKDKLMATHPCFIKLKGQHNHSLQSAETLSQLRVLPETKQTFFEYFEQGN